MSGPQRTRCVALQLATVTSAGQAPWSLAGTNRVADPPVREQGKGSIPSGADMARARWCRPERLATIGWLGVLDVLIVAYLMLNLHPEAR
jgi:hypothetical protein